MERRRMCASSFRIYNAAAPHYERALDQGKDGNSFIQLSRGFINAAPIGLYSEHQKSLRLAKSKDGKFLRPKIVSLGSIRHR